MIHKYKLNGFNIVIDVNSGAIHVLDDLAYDILENLDESMYEEVPEKIYDALDKKYDKRDIDETYEELYKMYKEGFLFSKDMYSDVMKDKTIDSPIKSMCINVSHDCNLRCEYCFAAKGDFGGDRILMSEEVGKKAIDFLIKNSGNRRNLEVDFFGGEPLMNFDVVKKIVNYARSLEEKYNKNFRFTITTNGLLLTDDKIDYINKEMSNVVLSLDGRKKVNDKLRVTEGDFGSYDTIVPKYQKLVRTRCDKDYYIRGTFTEHNLDFTKDVLHINELGFDQISVEPVVSDEKLDYSIKSKDIPRVFEEYELLAKTILRLKKKGSKINFFHFMLDLDNGPCAVKRLKGCGCGNEYVAVTPQGDIFPCHQFVGKEEWKLGNLLSGAFKDDMKKRFSKANIYNKSDCNDCWAKFYCSGGCNANNLQYEGEILKSHKMSCSLQKKRLECAIMVKAALAQPEKELQSI